MDKNELSEFVPHPGDLFMYRMMNPRYYYEADPFALCYHPPSQLEYLITGCWMASLHWFYKIHFCPSHKPLNTEMAKTLGRKVINNMKPIGEVFAAAMRLVEFVYLYADNWGFSTHWPMFWGVCRDLFELCTDCTNNHPTKATHIKQIRKFCDAARRFEPADPGFDAPHIKILLETVNRAFNDGSPYSEKLKSLIVSHKPKPGLVKTITLWTTSIDQKSSTTLRITETEFFVKKGSGKGVSRISPEWIEAEMWRRLKRLLEGDSRA